MWKWLKNDRNYGRTIFRYCIMIMLYRASSKCEFQTKNATNTGDQPHFSPDLALCDLFLYPKLKLPLHEIEKTLAYVVLHLMRMSELKTTNLIFNYIRPFKCAFFLYLINYVVLSGIKFIWSQIFCKLSI